MSILKAQNEQASNFAIVINHNFPSMAVNFQYFVQNILPNVEHVVHVCVYDQVHLL